MGNPAPPHPHACAQAAWIWVKAGCCQANRSIWPQEKHVQMPDASDAQMCMGVWQVPIRHPCSTGTQYLKGTCRKDGQGLAIRDCSGKTRGNSFKLKEG